MDEENPEQAAPREAVVDGPGDIPVVAAGLVVVGTGDAPACSDGVCF